MIYKYKTLQMNEANVDEYGIIRQIFESSFSPSLSISQHNNNVDVFNPLVFLADSL